MLHPSRDQSENGTEKAKAPYTDGLDDPFVTFFHFANQTVTYP